MPLSGELSPLFGLIRESGHANVAQRSRAQRVTRGHVQCLLPAGTILIHKSHCAPSCNNSLHSTTVIANLNLNLFCSCFSLHLQVALAEMREKNNFQAGLLQYWWPR